jgi:hypothetical protein
MNLGRDTVGMPKVRSRGKFQKGHTRSSEWDTRRSAYPSQARTSRVGIPVPWIRAFLRRGASEGIVFEHTNFRVDGGRVIYDFRVKQYASIVAAGHHGLTVVKDGKIVFDGTQATEPGSTSSASSASGNEQPYRR